MSVMKDVAKLAGVSTGTVSKYLNNQHTLKDKTKIRVEDAIKALQYKPNLLARSMRTGKTNTLAVIVPDITNPFFVEVYNSVKLSASQNGYVCILYTTDDNPDTLNHYLTGIHMQNVDGFVLCFIDNNKVIEEFIDELHSNTPMVFLSWDINNTKHSSVVIDVFEGIYISTRHLIEQGHKNIAYIGGPENDIISKEKFNGYTKAMESVGYEINQQLIFHNSYTLQSGYQAARKLTMLPVIPDALVAENDILAIGSIKYFLQRKINIPDDIAVIGFDNIPLSAMYEPALSTIALPITQMGSEAMKVLMSSIEKPSLKSKQIILKTNLIIRSSTNKNAPVEFGL
ncbi:MAG TPA: LacI family DNA-binding transcriptional regulator [Ruminiclostridium sp.]